jgi:hypothetical protein
MQSCIFFPYFFAYFQQRIVDSCINAIPPIQEPILLKDKL